MPRESPKGLKAKRGGKLLNETRTSKSDNWTEFKIKSEINDAWNDRFLALMKRLDKLDWSNSPEDTKKDFQNILGMFHYIPQIFLL